MYVCVNVVSFCVVSRRIMDCPKELWCFGMESVTGS